jgi:Mg2+-importing ATPase
LKLSSRYELADESDIQPLDPAAMARATAQFHALCEEGFRVLGIAWREEPATQSHVAVLDEKDFVFAGYAAFLDPPKASAGAAIAALKRSGIGIKILTGDNERVTKYVCTQLGIPIEGLLMDGFPAHEDALGARIEATNLFCRVTPSQRTRSFWR